MANLLKENVMRYSRMVLCVACVLFVSAGAFTGGPPALAAGQADVPVRKVVLFSSGVGYFEHAGQVTDDATIELRFKAGQINDLLKSLVLEDLDGGRIGTVVYPSHDPISKTLRSFQVDISANPSLGELLNQLRGAALSVEMHGQKIDGTILGVETKKVAVGKENTITVWVLNLISAGTIRAVRLDDVQNLQLQDEKLREELGRALAALAQARDQDKKPITIEFTGRGQRRVRLAYVVETPIWKTSYRLIMPPSNGAPAKLQGWAIVENQTDSDWQNVQLSLVSGRPISFVQNLYQPLYIPRPTVQPELYASLRPQTYDDGTDWDDEQYAVFWADAPATRVEELSAESRRRMRSKPRGPRGGGGGSLFGGGGGGKALDPMAAVASIASAGEMGELFQYVVGDVSLPRQKSAMIPIVTDPIEVERVSIYNSSVLAKHPLNGARVKNTTGKHLQQGPITVFDDHAYAGDAQIDNLPPGQERLLSYAIDLQVRVDPTKNNLTNTIQTGKIVRGVLEIYRKYVHSQEYLIKNESDRDKVIIVEHHLRPDWELVDSPEPIETTEKLYRFQDAVSAGKTSKLVINQEKVQSETIALLTSKTKPFELYILATEIPNKVRQELRKVMKMQNEARATGRDIEEHKSALTNITQEQSRIRSNMRSVKQTSEYYNRLLKKLNDQETRIEKLQMEIFTLEETYKEQREELEDYLSNLSVG